MRYCLICSVLLTFALPGMATEPASFRCSKPIDRGTATGESILAVTLDSDVYAATRRDFPDLRIFDARDHEVPCLLEKATEPRTRTVRNACQSTVVSLKERGDGLDVIVRLDADAPAADGLNIMTPLANYERRVSIEGSNDGLGWTPLLAGGVIFDYSRYMDIGNRELRLPYNSYRQFRLSISGIADAKESPFLDLTRKYRGGRETERTETTVLERRPFRIDRIELWHEQAEKTFEYDRKADYKAAGWRVEESPAAKRTIVEVTMRREPLTELTLETSSRNFSREATIQKSMPHGARTEWSDIGSGRISVVDFGGFHRATLGVSFPEERQTAYRIVIHNEDNPPLVITGVKPRGNVYRAVFLAAKGETYHLGYGSQEAAAPQYDAAIVLAPLRERQAPQEARLGVETPGAAPGEPPVDLRQLLNNPLFLGPVIAALVALLGWALWRATRRINELPKE